MERLEIFRNEVAHSRSNIICLLSWKHITSTISDAEEFIGHSDDVIETVGKEKAKDFESIVLVPVTFV